MKINLDSIRSNESIYRFGSIRFNSIGCAERLYAGIQIILNELPVITKLTGLQSQLLAILSRPPSQKFAGADPEIWIRLCPSPVGSGGNAPYIFFTIMSVADMQF